MSKKGLAAFIVGALVVGLPATASAAGTSVQLLTSSTDPLYPGITAWVSMTWRAKKGDAENVKVLVTDAPKGVAVAYPSKGSFTSLMQDSTLSEDETDFTAVLLSLSPTQDSFKMSLDLTFTSGGEAQIEQFDIKVPVNEPKKKAGDLVKLTDSAGSIASGSGGWVDVGYKGLVPSGVHAFKLTVTDADGLEIIYPDYGSQTSLSQNDTLDPLETDVARFYVDTSTAAPGTYNLGVLAQYTGGSLAGSLSLVVV